ncbi:MAG TPA: hypothetical protein VJU16_04305 [Planctomycetota bacterium]|nr:hypothetical protein [Planctomycetota bacterium]
MEKKLGGVLGILAAAAVIFAGVSQGVPAGETLVRAGLAFAAGGLVGWLVFGKLGAALMREAAGAEKKDEGPS